MKRFPSSRCASAIQIVRPQESIAETQQGRIQRVVKYHDIALRTREWAIPIPKTRQLFIGIDNELFRPDGKSDSSVTFRGLRT